MRKIALSEGRPVLDSKIRLKKAGEMPASFGQLIERYLFVFPSIP